MIDPDRWVRLLWHLHDRHVEDEPDLTYAERHAVLDFADIHERFHQPG